MVSQDSKAEFGLAYDGEALNEHTMDVRDLAPSLIAFGELFTRANVLLNGENTTVSLKVRATKPGSFELILILAQVYLSTTQFLTGEFVTSAVNLLSLAVGSNSLFSLIKKLKGKKPTIISQQSNMVVLKIDNIEVQIPAEVFRLYQDKEIKRLSEAIVEPLYQTGIDMMVIKKGEKQIEVITKQDAPSFTSATANDGEEIENIIPLVALRLVSPTFDWKRAKWRLDDGSGKKWYGIEDEKFLREVRENKRRFGMGDYLICRVKTLQRLTDKGLEFERTILRVLDQRKAGEQLPLNNIRTDGL